jgi:hypothetical protein
MFLAVLSAVLRISQLKADVYEHHGTYISTLRGGWVFVDRRIVQSYVGTALLDGTNVRLNWNIESDLNVYCIKLKNFLSLY